jgi:hypothetical protein
MRILFVEVTIIHFWSYGQEKRKIAVLESLLGDVIIRGRVVRDYSDQLDLFQMMAPTAIAWTDHG